MTDQSTFSSATILSSGRHGCVTVVLSRVLPLPGCFQRMSAPPRADADYWGHIDELTKRLVLALMVDDVTEVRTYRMSVSVSWPDTTTVPHATRARRVASSLRLSGLVSGQVLEIPRELPTDAGWRVVPHATRGISLQVADTSEPTALQVGWAATVAAMITGDELFFRLVYDGSGMHLEPTDDPDDEGGPVLVLLPRFDDIGSAKLARLLAAAGADPALAERLCRIVDEEAPA